MLRELDHYWSIPTTELFRQFGSVATEEGRNRQQEVGLSSNEANLRLTKYGKNVVEPKKKTNGYPY